MTEDVSTNGWSSIDASPRRSLWDGLRLLPSSVWLPLGAVLLLAGSVFFLNTSAIESLRRQGEEVTRLMQVQNDLVELRAGLVDAETGQRGYLLTRDPAYLEPFERAVRDLPTLAANVRNNLDSPELTSKLTALDELRGRMFAEIGASIKLAQQGDRTEAIGVVRSGQGTKLYEAFRASADELIRIVDRQIQETRNAQQRNVDVFRMASGALGLLTIVLLALTVRLFMREAMRREDLRLTQEAQRHRLEDLISVRTAELSELSTHLQNVLEEEKAHLARDLHDEMGGLLTAARMDLSWLEGRSATLDDEFKAKLADLSTALVEAMNLKRRVVESLRPALLDHFGLPMALKAYFEETCEKAGLACRTSIAEDADKVPQPVAIALFRVAQEALTNIIRHANAKNVEIEFRLSDDDYRIRIGDDGSGMDLSRTSTSHGLAGMRHRMHSIGARFNIDSAKGRGTRIDISGPRLPATESVPKAGISDA